MATTMMAAPLRIFRQLPVVGLASMDAALIPLFSDEDDPDENHRHDQCIGAESDQPVAHLVVHGRPPDAVGGAVFRLSEYGGEKVHAGSERPGTVVSSSPSGCERFNRCMR